MYNGEYTKDIDLNRASKETFYALSKEEQYAALNLLFDGMEIMQSLAFHAGGWLSRYQKDIMDNWASRSRRIIEGNFE